MGSVDRTSIRGGDGIGGGEQGTIDQARRIDEECRPGLSIGHIVNATLGMLDGLDRFARGAFVPDSLAILGKAKRFKGDKPHDHGSEKDERAQRRQLSSERDQHEHQGRSHKTLDA